MNVNLVSSQQRTVQSDQYLEFSLRAVIEKKPEPVAAPAAKAPEPKPANKKGTTR
jgi:hypothetical protein